MPVRVLYEALFMLKESFAAVAGYIATVAGKFVAVAVFIAAVGGNKK